MKTNKILVSRKQSKSRSQSSWDLLKKMLYHLEVFLEDFIPKLFFVKKVPKFSQAYPNIQFDLFGLMYLGRKWSIIHGIVAKVFHHRVSKICDFIQESRTSRNKWPFLGREVRQTYRAYPRYHLSWVWARKCTKLYQNWYTGVLFRFYLTKAN